MGHFAGIDYQPGGSLPPEASSYVERQADRDLFEALRAGTYCYVLNSRQMGKSSLRVRTAERLYEAGITCVEIELLGIGSQQITATQWYGGIIQELIRGLGLKINRRQWLKEHEDLSPIQRLGTFIDQILLPQLKQSLVIFFDEIDSLLGLSFPTDEFFGLVRSWYEKRATNPAYNQLTIVMLGVATPSELIRDVYATPFNIGRAIELSGFQIDECQGLALGLSSHAHDPSVLLSAILDWTGGQPFLTQKLCFLVTQQRQEMGCKVETGQENHFIEQLVRSRLLNDWEAQDEPEHLRTIRNRILRNARCPATLLQLYQQILRRGHLTVDDSDLQRELRLSGLVTRQRGRLQSFNRIYRTIFDRNWVDQQLKYLPSPQHSAEAFTQTTSQKITLPLWQVPLWAIAAVVVVLGGRSLGWLQPLELYAYDQMLRWRVAEPADERFLIVTVDEADIQYQDQQAMTRQGSLSDEALHQLIRKLQPHGPRVIGLDFYHDFPFKPELGEALQQMPGFVAACEIGQTVDVGTPISIASPPGIAPASVGFTDFVLDPSGYTVRQQILGMDSTQICPTPISFNLKVALQYLNLLGLEEKFLEDGRFVIGDRIFPKLSSKAGAYQDDEGTGYRLMVNYRHQDPKKVSLRSVLEGAFDHQLGELVRDRIVLIGLDNPKDAHFTPMRLERTLGVVVHAHMASQLISAVLDDRPIIMTPSPILALIWISSWTVAGSLVIVCCSQTNESKARPIIVFFCPLIAVTGCSYLLLLYGGWYPWVPIVLSLSLFKLSLDARDQIIAKKKR